MTQEMTSREKTRGRGGEGKKREKKDQRNIPLPAEEAVLILSSRTRGKKEAFGKGVRRKGERGLFPDSRQGRKKKKRGNGELQDEVQKGTIDICHVQSGMPKQQGSYSNLILSRKKRKFWGPPKEKPRDPKVSPLEGPNLSAKKKTSGEDRRGRTALPSIVRRDGKKGGEVRRIDLRFMLSRVKKKKREGRKLKGESRRSLYVPVKGFPYHFLVRKRKHWGKWGRRRDSFF